MNTTANKAQLTPEESAERSVIQNLWRKHMNQPAYAHLIGSPDEWAFWTALLRARSPSA